MKAIKSNNKTLAVTYCLGQHNRFHLKINWAHFFHNIKILHAIALKECLQMARDESKVKSNSATMAAKASESKLDTSF